VGGDKVKEVYLVTGAAGNLGGSVVRELLAQGKEVRALVLPGDQAARRLPPSVEKMEGDILKPEDLDRFLTLPPGREAIVIHCAGLVATVWGYDPRVYRVNVGGTRNVVAACLKARVKKLVYTSSVHAIPEQPGGGVMREISEFAPEKIVGYYGKSKAMASQVVMDAVREQGLDATIVFPSGLCGPQDYAYGYVTQLLIDSAGGKLPAGVKGGYNFADVRDVAAGVVAACSKGKKGETYILGNRYVPVEEIMQYVHEETGARLVKRMVPVGLARLFLPAFTLYYKARGRRPLFTRYSLYTLTSNSNFSLEKATRELGYKVRPFRETIGDALKWLQAEGKISLRLA
jgi:dihydroflavonol-4-reductase